MRFSTKIMRYYNNSKDFKVKFTINYSSFIFKVYNLNRTLCHKTSYVLIMIILFISNRWLWYNKWQLVISIGPLKCHYGFVEPRLNVNETALFFYKNNIFSYWKISFLLDSTLTELLFRLNDVINNSNKNNSRIILFI